MEESNIIEIVESGGHYFPHINVHDKSCNEKLAEICLSTWHLPHAEF
jgi:hypothetical protein